MLATILMEPPGGSHYLRVSRYGSNNEMYTGGLYRPNLTLLPLQATIYYPFVYMFFNVCIMFNGERVKQQDIIELAGTQAVITAADEGAEAANLFTRRVLAVPSDSPPFPVCISPSRLSEIRYMDVLEAGGHLSHFASNWKTLGVGVMISIIHTNHITLLKNTAEDLVYYGVIMNVMYRLMTEPHDIRAGTLYFQ